MPDSTASDTPRPETIGEPFGQAWPERDRNGLHWADSSLDLRIVTSRDGSASGVLSLIDSDPLQGDDTPEGFAVVLVPLDALRALSRALSGMLAAVDAR